MLELFLALHEPIKSPLLIEPEPIAIVEPVIELTIEEKIEQNVFNCDESIYFIRADNAECLAKPVVAIQTPSSRNTQVSRQSQPQTIRNGSNGTLIGSYGSVRSGGNCVNTARAHGKIQPGNPITWSVSTRTPFIGAAALFNYNHVAIISGIWDNGDIEVIHENFSGSRTRFSQAEMRGYF